jgi:molybdenum cofactor biosynthesis enzyme MoaA
MIDKVFCPIPWTEVHINADGTYHSCGAQPNRITGTPAAAKYNVQSMTIDEWLHSEHQDSARASKLAGVSDPLCAMCYHEETVGSSSKRIKENHKSGISVVDFHKTFDPAQFTKPAVNSFHISLGNECNLACRMCTPNYSSKLAVEAIRNGTWRGSARMNWTDDLQAWNHVVDYICRHDVQFVHLLGGEPLLNPRFEDLIDRLLAANKTNIYLGFTTNGTVFNEQLMQKLNAFRHVDVGVSVECMGLLNDYIRQGSSTQTVLNNIDLYLKHRKQGHVYVTVRAVPSALSVHELDSLYAWCVSRQLDVMTNILVSPAYLQISQLPQDIKDRLLDQYAKWEHSEPAPADSNPRDPNWFKQHIDSEVKAIIKALEQPNDPNLTQELYEKLALWHWLNEPQIAKYFDSNIKA